MALVLRRKSLKVWTHEFNGRPVYITPKANFNTPNETFLIVEQFGSRLGVYNPTNGKVEGVPVADISVYDDVNSGSAETFTTVTELSLRLEELAYPAFYRDGEIVSISGYIQAGSGVTFTGLGTLASPYVISAGAGSLSWHEDYVTFAGVAIAVPSGFKGSVRNMDSPQSEVTNTVVTTNLTVTAGANNGDRLMIFGIY